MHPLSPIRSTSPLSRPKITFNYPPSPLRERALNRPPPTSLPLQNGNPSAMHKPQSAPIPVASQPQLCKICSKQVSYRDINDDSKYCSHCAIGQMRKGTNLVRIQLKEQKFYKEYYHKNDKENLNNQERFGHDHNLNQPKQKGKTGRNEAYSRTYMLNETDVLKADLQILLQKLQNKEWTIEGVKSIHRQKKINLKSHYQRIKNTIKLSIDRDLQELERREAVSLKYVQEMKEEIENELKSIDKIKSNLQNTEQQYLDHVIQQSISNLSAIKQSKKTATQITSQLTIEPQSSDSLNVRLTQEQAQPKGELYEPNIYSLFKSQRKQTLFSLDGNSK